MAIERKKFREIFQEDSKENLTLLVDVKVKGTTFRKGFLFNSVSGLGGVNFHQFRYSDVAIEKEGEIWEIKGFFTEE